MAAGTGSNPVHDPGPVRSLSALIRLQLDDVLASLSQLTDDARAVRVDLMCNVLAGSLRNLSVDEMVSVCALFGIPPLSREAPRPVGVHTPFGTTPLPADRRRRA